MLGALVAGALVAGCLVRNVRDRRLTGTCDGACAYYLGCKNADEREARATCVAECGEVFASRQTIADFESLSCQDAVEFVDGVDPPS